jgi:hypothetical protein
VVSCFNNIGADPNGSAEQDHRGHHYRISGRSGPSPRPQSTEVYKGKPTDIRQIGRDLNEVCAWGGIQSLGDQIRVSAQLIEAAQAATL